MQTPLVLLLSKLDIGSQIAKKRVKMCLQEAFHEVNDTGRYAGEAPRENFSRDFFFWGGSA